MAGRVNVYSVSQVSAYIKNMFAQDYALNRISVKGEISNLKYHSSGHIYFTLKDRGAQISCVMFASWRAGLSFRMEDGQQVVASGSVEVYEKYGSYQLYARSIELAGAGDLYAKYEKLKRDLEAEGLFDRAHKKPIPRYARTVGIVTADTGAAIHDIMRIASRRNPYVQLILCPAKVQGEGAAESIVQGIRRLDAMGLDILIVGRGGGSFEDLFCFSEEAVVRAVYAAKTPIISAVGHDVDYPISDFAADLRAATPSDAAELAVYDVNLLESQIAGAGERLNLAIDGVLKAKRHALRQYALALHGHSPARELNSRRQRLADLADRMEAGLYRKISGKKDLLGQRRAALSRGIRMLLKERRQRLAVLAGKLDGRSPLKKVSGGFGFVTDDRGQGLTSVFDALPGEPVHIRISDGRIDARVTGTEPDGTAESAAGAGKRGTAESAAGAGKRGTAESAAGAGKRGITGIPAGAGKDREEDHE